jgi:elongation factor P--(R)-beta-lysine ligase
MSLVHRLKHRCQKLNEVRSFFQSRGYLELDPPSLTPFAVPTPYIEPINTRCNRFLHTSPEIEMKKIISQIRQDCFFLGHVFRHEEVGPLHSEEFTMIEYYKCSTNKNDFLKEVIDLLALFIDTTNIQNMSYQEAFNRYVPSNYKAHLEIKHLSDSEKRHWAWGVYVEKKLSPLTIIYDFLAEDASLAKLNENGHANRFEFYFQGIELANAFEELTDSTEQEARFINDNQERTKQGLKPLPYDPDFIASLAQIPQNTFGIALGFDRLVKLSYTKQATLVNAL